MTLDCDKYRLSQPLIASYINNKSIEDVRKSMSLLSIATHVPVIVVICYAIELVGPDRQLLEALELNKKFYQITELLNFKGV